MYGMGLANVGWMVGDVEYCPPRGQQDEGVGDLDDGVPAGDFCCGESPSFLARSD